MTTGLILLAATVVVVVVVAAAVVVVVGASVVVVVVAGVNATHLRDLATFAQTSFWLLTVTTRPAILQLAPSLLAASACAPAPANTAAEIRTEKNFFIRSKGYPLIGLR